MKKYFAYLILIIFWSCERNTVTEPSDNDDTSVITDTIRFADLNNLFRNRCYQCHSEKEYSFYALNLDSYENIMAGSQNGQVVIPNDPINSMLYLKCAGEHSTGDRMPQGSPNYFDNNSEKLRLIYDWINFGCIE